MKIWKKIALSSATILAAMSLVGCSNKSSNSSATSSNSNKPLLLWVDTDRLSWYKGVVKNFEKKYPNIKVRVTQSPNGSANAKTDVGKDPTKAADVFSVPHDQLGQMANAGYINPLSPNDTSTVKKDNVNVAIKGATWKGRLYAFPYAEQDYVLFYNKSKLNANDVKTWDTLTKKGVVGTKFTSAYSWFPVFFTAGAKLYGENGNEPEGSDLANNAGVNAMKWLAAQKKNKGAMQTTNALNQLSEGKADAIMDGPMDGVNIKKILGKNLGVAPYPTIKIGGQTKQLQSFLGIECFAINSRTKNAKNAATLARFLTNKEQQLVVHEKRGEIPTNKSAQQDSTVKSDPIAKSVMTMAQPDHSTIMPKLPQMLIFWDNANALVSGAYDGKIKPAQYKPQLTKFEKTISKKN
ncbi:sugar ABC transporter, sugar-binding protein [Lactobacillus crispatus]|uniref:extracellular solute-binding protein n=1 Tax=Lactobacillus crispatus TaxID=47770 RepID=UPI0018E389C1|nr:extracellular solute-binding protein [Lactobacillus crispatus]MBI1693858.1 sugar ABC transporter, sugar-binding protein [Lactobacillus crispatus]